MPDDRRPIDPKQVLSRRDTRLSGWRTPRLAQPAAERRDWPGAAVDSVSSEMSPWRMPGSSSPDGCRPQRSFAATSAAGVVGVAATFAPALTGPRTGTPTGAVSYGQSIGRLWARRSRGVG